jgi:hypothetical protein
MSTFGEMQSYVSKRLLDPNNISVSSSDVAQAINDAISYWKFRRFWFNEVSDTATMTAQDPSFPYPSDFLVPATKDDGFNIHYSAMRYPLAKITQQQYDGLFLTNGYGIPRWYARIGNEEYKCYPIPDQAYTVGRHYLKDYDALVNTSDTNDFTENADRLINLWALANLSAELRQDDKMEAYYRQAANDEYRNLRVMTNKANGTGKLTIYSNL